MGCLAIEQVPMGQIESVAPHVHVHAAFLDARELGNDIAERGVVSSVVAVHSLRVKIREGAL